MIEAALSALSIPHGSGAVEAAAGVIPGARHIPLEKLEDVAADLPKDREVLLYCANGIRAEMAHETLSGLGIRNRFLNETV